MWGLFTETPTTLSTAEESRPAERGNRSQHGEMIMVKITEEAVVKAEQEAQAMAEQEARINAEARIKVEEEIANFQELGEEGHEAATFLAASFETIAGESTAYSQKALENGSAFLEKLFAVESFESAIQIQSEYATASYADFCAFLTRMGELYSKLIEEAFGATEAINRQGSGRQRQRNRSVVAGGH